ncbi:MAG: hypothetical protein AB8B55_02735 [Mariniblastus sp.]
MRLTFRLSKSRLAFIALEQAALGVVEVPVGDSVGKLSRALSAAVGSFSAAGEASEINHTTSGLAQIGLAEICRAKDQQGCCCESLYQSASF